MKIEVNTKEFQAVVTKLLKVTPKKSSIPVLESILIEATKETVTLTAWDSNNRVTIKLVNPHILDSGSFAIPSDTVKIVLKLKSNVLTITDGVIQSDNRELKFKSFDQESYPKQSKIAFSQQAFKLPLSNYLNVFDVRYACCTSESRPILQGVLIRDNKAVACDGHRLAIKDFENELTNDIVINSDTLKIIELMSDKKSKGEITALVDVKEIKLNNQIRIQHNNIKFQFDNVTIESRLIDSIYPDVSKLIATTFQNEIRVKKSELVEELTLAKEITDDKLNSVQIASSNNVLTLSSKDSTATNTMATNLNVTPLVGSELEKMAFNAAYMLDGLKYNNNEYVTLKFTGKSSPIMVDSECLILPYRTA